LGQVEHPLHQTIIPQRYAAVPFVIALPMKTTSTAANLLNISKAVSFQKTGNAYPAVAANTSIVFAIVQYDKTNAKNVVKQSMAPIRFKVVSMRYRPNITIPGKREARTEVRTLAADFICFSG